jgi:hypothetical protein
MPSEHGKKLVFLCGSVEGKDYERGGTRGMEGRGDVGVRGSLRGRALDSMRM